MTNTTKLFFVVALVAALAIGGPEKAEAEAAPTPEPGKPPRQEGTSAPTQTPQGTNRPSTAPPTPAPPTSVVLSPAPSSQPSIASPKPSKKKDKAKPAPAVTPAPLVVLPDAATPPARPSPLAIDTAKKQEREAVLEEMDAQINAKRKELDAITAKVNEFIATHNTLQKERDFFFSLTFEDRKKYVDQNGKPAEEAELAGMLIAIDSLKAASFELKEELDVMIKVRNSFNKS